MCVWICSYNVRAGTIFLLPLMVIQVGVGGGKIPLCNRTALQRQSAEPRPSPPRLKSLARRCITVVMEKKSELEVNWKKIANLALQPFFWVLHSQMWFFGFFLCSRSTHFHCGVSKKKPLTQPAREPGANPALNGVVHQNYNNSLRPLHRSIAMTFAGLRAHKLIFLALLLIPFIWGFPSVFFN